MDAQVDEIVSGIPMSQLADQLGVDQGTAESAVRQALPALLGGMQANAQDPAGAASLAQAVDQHSPQLVDGGVNLDEVDTDDGQKIVSHVFGSNSGDVAHTLGGLGGLGGMFGGGQTGAQGGAGGSDLIQKLLPILAPIVLSYLAQRMRGGGGQAAEGGGGGIGDLLGSILGGGQTGGSASGQSSQSGSILDMLGNLLGGGRR